MAETLDYGAMVDNAMRGVVRDILRKVERSGLPGDHHFFISFRTDHPATRVSETLRNRFPEEMTIVLQHQFWDLRVEQEYFSASLSFNGVPEKLVVPYAALTGFADPSTKFGMQFHDQPLSEDDDYPEMLQSELLPLAKEILPSEEPKSKEGAQILTLDAFRKK